MDGYLDEIKMIFKKNGYKNVKIKHDKKYFTKRKIIDGKQKIINTDEIKGFTIEIFGYKPK